MGLIPSSWARSPAHRRWAAYVMAGTVAGGLAGAWLVIVLLACGLLEVLLRRERQHGQALSLNPLALFAVVAGANGGLLALIWTAFKVGALSYGGGFVIVPLMQGDAVDRFHWMTSAQFLNAVALGQVRPAR